MSSITNDLQSLDERAFGAVTEIVTFGGAVFEHFDLPATLGPR